MIQMMGLMPTRYLGKKNKSEAVATRVHIDLSNRLLISKNENGGPLHIACTQQQHPLFDLAER